MYEIDDQTPTPPTTSRYTLGFLKQSFLIGVYNPASENILDSKKESREPQADKDNSSSKKKSGASVVNEDGSLKDNAPGASLASLQEFRQDLIQAILEQRAVLETPSPVAGATGSTEAEGTASQMSDIENSGDHGNSTQERLSESSDAKAKNRFEAVLYPNTTDKEMPIQPQAPQSENIDLRTCSLKALLPEIPVDPSMVSPPFEKKCSSQAKSWLFALDRMATLSQAVKCVEDSEGRKTYRIEVAISVPKTAAPCAAWWTEEHDQSLLVGTYLLGCDQQSLEVALQGHPELKFHDLVGKTVAVPTQQSSSTVADKANEDGSHSASLNTCDFSESSRGTRTAGAASTVSESDKNNGDVCAAPALKEIVVEWPAYSALTRRFRTLVTALKKALVKDQKQKTAHEASRKRKAEREEAKRQKKEADEEAKEEARKKKEEERKEKAKLMFKNSGKKPKLVNQCADSKVRPLDFGSPSVKEWEVEKLPDHVVNLASALGTYDKKLNYYLGERKTPTILKTFIESCTKLENDYRMLKWRIDGQLKSMQKHNLSVQLRKAKASAASNSGLPVDETGTLGKVEYSATGSNMAATSTDTQVQSAEASTTSEAPATVAPSTASGQTVSATMEESKPATILIDQDTFKKVQELFARATTQEKRTKKLVKELEQLLLENKKKRQEKLKRKSLAKDSVGSLEKKLKTADKSPSSPPSATTPSAPVTPPETNRLPEADPTNPTNATSPTMPNPPQLSSMAKSSPAASPAKDTPKQIPQANKSAQTISLLGQAGTPPPRKDDAKGKLAKEFKVNNLGCVSLSKKNF